MACRNIEEFDNFHRQWDELPVQRLVSVRLGGLIVNLEFSGEALQSIIVDALSHLAVDPTLGADLTIRIWDSGEQKKLPPQLEWRKVYANGYRGYHDGDYFFHYHAQIGAISFLDCSKSIAYFITRNASELPWWVRGSPLQVILSAWMRTKGLQLTHVAAVGNGQHCVLLAGKGGSGKTTTALDCLLFGLNFLGEDYCLLRPGNPPKVFSVYQSAKWTPKTRGFHPDFETLIANRDSPVGDKSLLFYQDIFRTQLVESLPAKAVLSLCVGEQPKPRLSRGDISTSLKNLSLTTIKQLPFFDPLTLTLLKQFCTGLTEPLDPRDFRHIHSGLEPTLGSQSAHYRLELGQQRQSNVEVIIDLLNGNR